MKKSTLVLLSTLVILASAQSPEKRTGPYLGQKLPEAAPGLFAPGIVASKHASVTISRDGTEIYLSDDRYLIFLRNSDLWLSFRGEDGRWKPARRLETPAGAVCPYVSPDGKFFFLKFDRGTFGVYWMDASGLGLGMV